MMMMSSLVAVDFGSLGSTAVITAIVFTFILIYLGDLCLNCLKDNESKRKNVEKPLHSRSELRWQSISIFKPFTEDNVFN